MVRNFDGEVFSPVVVCSRYAACASHCKRGTELGDSVFIGVPARSDVIAVCTAEGFDLLCGW